MYTQVAQYKNDYGTLTLNIYRENGGDHMETKGYPHAGINHPVAKLVSYRKMTVSQEEYELVIQHRKDKIEAVKRLAGLI